MYTQYYNLSHISAILIIFLFSSCAPETNKESFTEENQITESSIQVNQTSSKEIIVPPNLSLLKSPTMDGNNLVSFRFRSSKAGSISYSGSCFGLTKNAIKGDHYIKFVTMVEGTYADCAIKVTDSEGYTSKPLNVPSFKVDFTSPELSQVGNSKVQGRKVKIEIKSSEAVSLIYSGNCSGDLKHMKQGNSEVSLTFPSDGQYNDCEVFLRDSSGNTSEPLPLGTVRIDIATPVLTEVKSVPENVQTNRPSYSFKTSKSGTLKFIGKCKGNVDKAVVGINHITLLITEPGDYNNCTLTLTDSSNNKSQPLNISPFVVVAGQS